jgi:hypothetical protein
MSRNKRNTTYKFKFGLARALRDSGFFLGWIAYNGQMQSNRVEPIHYHTFKSKHLSTESITFCANIEQIAHKRSNINI